MGASYSLKHENTRTLKHKIIKKMKESFKDKLKLKMDNYVHFVYKVTRTFPEKEIYGVVSQIRRATLLS